MTTYVVGDIQGCYQSLKCLLDQVAFNWTKDRLWLVGDLVNRGPKSLKTLRFLYQHRDRINCVLGNHDLHLLAVANGLHPGSSSDTFEKILVAEDRDELLEWLRNLPLIHSDHGYTMVHAGIPPMWSLKKAHKLAQEVQEELRGPNYRRFLSAMYGDTPAGWSSSLTGLTRLRVITNYLTRMRFITPEGELDLTNKGPIDAGDSSTSVIPWFTHPQRKAADDNIIFGHWAALEGVTDTPNVYATDTGCVWGRALSMYCLETEQWHRCDC